VTFLIFIIILLYLQGAKNEIKTTAKYFIPMALIIVILNPLFSHVGTTKIVLFNNYFITVESLVYGLLMAFSLLIILLLFVSFNKYVDYQKLLYLSSNHFPIVSMIGVRTMRFIPLLNYRLGEVNKIFNFNNYNSNESKMDKIRKIGAILAIVISWSLEESMLTAKSMKARGYGITKRTSYLKYNIGKIDVILIIITVLTSIVCLFGLYFGVGNTEVCFSKLENLQFLTISLFFKK